jgi:hypothetical protein
VTFRAAGTSLSGQAITDSVLIKMSHVGKNFRRYEIMVSHWGGGGREEDDVHLTGWTLRSNVACEGGDVGHRSIEEVVLAHVVCAPPTLACGPVYG